jgi:hypothetical protein
LGAKVFCFFFSKNKTLLPAILRCHASWPKTRAMTHASRAILAFPVLAALAGCAAGQKLTPDDREAVSDCNKESDRIFAARNQYELSERDSRDTPFSGNTLPPTPSDGLSDQYERENLRDSCLAHSAAGNAVVPGTTPTDAKP